MARHQAFIPENYRDYSQYRGGRHYLPGTDEYITRYAYRTAQLRETAPEFPTIEQYRRSRQFQTETVPPSKYFKKAQHYRALRGNLLLSNPRIRLELMSVPHDKFLLIAKASSWPTYGVRLKHDTGVRSVAITKDYALELFDTSESIDDFISQAFDTEANGVSMIAWRPLSG